MRRKVRLTWIVLILLLAPSIVLSTVAEGFAVVRWVAMASALLIVGASHDFLASVIKLDDERRAAEMRNFTQSRELGEKNERVERLYKALERKSETIEELKKGPSRRPVEKFEQDHTEEEIEKMFRERRIHEH